ncbi:MAG: hypothetical protein J0H21_13725 [Rhizobiales bacterium]|nr:hypothetical protein [Hyphomicrobiales bacterium]
MTATKARYSRPRAQAPWRRVWRQHENAVENGHLAEQGDADSRHHGVRYRGDHEDGNHGDDAGDALQAGAQQPRAVRRDGHDGDLEDVAERDPGPERSGARQLLQDETGRRDAGEHPSHAMDSDRKDQGHRQSVGGPEGGGAVGDAHQPYAETACRHIEQHAGGEEHHGKKEALHHMRPDGIFDRPRIAAIR